MNIFVLDHDIDTCAKYHVDKHVVKMILESAQLLSTAVRLSGIDVGYKATHSNHPCSIWTRQSLSNWIWLKDLTDKLNTEYMYRYGKTNAHKSHGVAMSLPNPNIPDIGLTPFALAMPDEFKNNDPVKSYRDYYINCKKHIAVWSKRPIPEWWNYDKTCN
jgi:hypothetical protein